MKTVLHYLRPRLGIMSVGLLIKFFGTVAELLLPWMLSVILDEAVPAGALGGILFWGGLMVLCAAAALGGNVIANRLACSTSRDVTRRLRHDLFARVMQLSCAQEDAFTTPSLISRLTSDTYNVHQMVDRMQRLGVRAPILLVGGIALTLSLEPVLTLVLIATLPLLGLVVWFVSTRAYGFIPVHSLHWTPWYGARRRAWLASASSTRCPRETMSAPALTKPTPVR